MTKEEFNNLIQSKKRLRNKLKNIDVENIQIQFPYCEIIHNVALLKANIINDVNFTKILTKSAIYSSNRENLFHLINPSPQIKTHQKNKKITYLFEDWLKEMPKSNKPTIKKTWFKKNLKNSLKDDYSLTTETLAKIYVDQELYERALQAYKILCLKYPKKSSFFANQIEKIKNKIK